ncbi:MAG: hypothetical protein K2P99_06785 [Burkholderiales bacterium]|nr:hypothetical protein [Burkholderiales bacterium]
MMTIISKIFCKLKREENKKILLPVGKVAISTLAKMVSTLPVLASLQPLLDIVKEYQQEQFEYFIEELNKNIYTRTITITDINKNSIANATYKMYLAMLKVREKEKVAVFANLYYAYLITIDNAIEGRQKYNYNWKYDLFLSIIDNLTFIEYDILLILYKHQSNTERKSQTFSERIDYDNDLQYSSSFWEAFIMDVNTKYGFEESQVKSLLSKATMTGFYLPITGNYLGYTGGKGLVSSLFKDFINFIDNKAP